MSFFFTFKPIKPINYGGLRWSALARWWRRQYFFLSDAPCFEIHAAPLYPSMQITCSGKVMGSIIRTAAFMGSPTDAVQAKFVTPSTSICKTLKAWHIMWLVCLFFSCMTEILPTSPRGSFLWSTEWSVVILTIEWFNFEDNFNHNVMNNLQDSEFLVEK